MTDNLVMEITGGAQEFIVDLVKDFFDVNNIKDRDSLIDIGFDDYCEPQYSDTKVATGATKIVLIPLYKNFVIKIPSYGESDYGPWSGAYSKRLEELGYEIDTEDYCLLEANLYERAVEEGVSQFLVPTAYFGMVNNIPVYVQPKIHYLYSKAKHDETSEYSYASIKNSYILTPDCGAELLLYYTQNEVVKFLQFVVDYGINDLEACRNGWYVNEYQRYVFWDYSGFHDI